MKSTVYFPPSTRERIYLLQDQNEIYKFVNMAKHIEVVIQPDAEDAF